MTEWGVTLKATVVGKLHVSKPVAHDLFVFVHIEAVSFLQLVYVDGMMVGGTFTAGIIGGIGNQDFSSHDNTGRLIAQEEQLKFQRSKSASH